MANVSILRRKDNKWLTPDEIDNLLYDCLSTSKFIWEVSKSKKLKKVV